jgi:dTDP-4-amino-4,6-dideoxygalactose transaminase
MISVTKTYLPDLNLYRAYLDQIWNNNQLTNNGPLYRELCRHLKAYCNIQNLELVSNGTLALQLAIKALNLRGEIITTPYSYVATTNAILWEGCEPVFADIDENSFCINADLIESAITKQTSAILATHVYGYPCDVRKIDAIAKRHGLKVIYDAAHAFGVKYHGRSLLAYGDCSAVSFHATKLFHTAEGGAIVCQDEEVSRRAFLMSKFGHMGEEAYLDLGINAKMSELHAAMGLCVLPKVDEIISARKQRSACYDTFLKESPLQKPMQTPGLDYNYAYYPVVFPSHETMVRARQALLDQGIGPRRYFYPSLNTLPFLKRERKQPCPVSEAVAERVLCLPLYPQLEWQDIERVCRITLGVLS